jgi:hypothetical protein
MSETDKSVALNEVEIYYHKSNFFRVVHADGCYGGVTPRGSIHCAFFSERGAIPLRTSLSIVEGQAATEKTLESKPGLVRELEVDLVMDFNVAVTLYVWLFDKLDALRKAMNIPDEQWAQMTGGKK